MPRTARSAVGGAVYHVLNRGNGRLNIFRKPGDYAAFLQLLMEGLEHARVEVFGFCLMPNHWHFIVRPEHDGQVTAFFRWLTHTHAMRAITHRRVLGMGPLYRGAIQEPAGAER